MGVAKPRPFLPHQPGLDGLRGIAVLAVIGFHAGLPGFADGAQGVTVFFVLSGFLITTILAKEWLATGGIGFRRFYIRRALRLFPALVALLLMAFILGSLVLSGAELQRLRTEILSSATYATNWVLASKPSFPSDSYLGHTWSLAVEEQFYLAWPLLLFALLRFSRSWSTLRIALVTMIVVSVGVRALLMETGYRSHAAYGLDANAAPLLLGCLLATGFVSSATPLFDAFRGMQQIVGAFGCTYLAVAIAFGDRLPLPLGLRDLGVALATVVVIDHIVLASRSLIHRVLEWKPLTATGRISYGLYLWHFPIFAIVKSERFAWAAWQLLAAKLAISVAIALVSFRFVESPLLRLKHQLRGPPERVSAGTTQPRSLSVDGTTG